MTKTIKISESNLDFLKILQKQMRYEDEFDNDIQANPRFWVIMDYRTVPANQEYDDGFVEYFYSDGDYYKIDTLEELKEEIKEFFDDDEDINNNEILSALMKNGSFESLWEYLERNLNENGYYQSCYSKQESFIVPNTMFITKKEAVEHLKRNKHHYSSKAHTYAMTAWRSPHVEKLINLLLEIDLY